jgi:hypothetical protein
MECRSKDSTICTASVDSYRLQKFSFHYSHTVLFTGRSVCFLIVKEHLSTVPYNRSCVAVVCVMQLETHAFEQIRLSNWSKNFISKLQGTKSTSIIKTNWLTSFREVIGICCDSDTKLQEPVQRYQEVNCNGLWTTGQTCSFSSRDYRFSLL